MNWRKCCATDCQRMVQSRYLMCPPCWALVSKPTQRAVYAAYQDGQETGTPAPSAAWREAADRAIEEVAAHGRPQSGRLF